ncbi:hypothetical protein H2199_008629 [Coniosporium tulheliwenetii]|uniref:Uncharacterized protein n=1 Tax=Coniosporium tulheliwenetii TaxID=3383036 RepID=A0ACC2YIX9_9PEZI|nr:hypothetical protein H2199_008629 [Cladosporium sp. JES 115]
MNEALMTRIKHLESKTSEVEERCKSLAAEKKELEEQNRDLSFFISGQEKLQAMAAEEGARMEVGAAPEERRKRKGKGRKQG